jgi:hypothetical protein
MGVWVSGFFGSGKSHFIKILSYLLKNRSVCDPDKKQEAKAFDLLAPKVDDPMLLAADTDVILFNIDSRADSKDGRGTILSVFMGVFNEMQEFCGDTPHIPDLERVLCEKGKYESFCRTFKDITGSEWRKDRDSYLLWRDEVVEALFRTYIASYRPESSPLLHCERIVPYYFAVQIKEHHVQSAHFNACEINVSTVERGFVYLSARKLFCKCCVAPAGVRDLRKMGCYHRRTQ